MASVGAIWGPATLRLLRVAVTRTAKAVRVKLANATRPLQGELQYIPIRTGNVSRQPIHPAAVLKQQGRQSKRWFSSATRQSINASVRRYFSTSESGVLRLDRSKLPSSNTSRRVGTFSGRAPFASTLRPNLTGGALPRTAGGYSLGGGARYFSHTPAAPAQVVQNVSQALRAFMLGGNKLRYDGVNARGAAQYRAVSNMEDQAINKLANIPRSAPGAFVDFQLSPTVTALSPLAAAITQASDVSGFNGEPTVDGTNLNTEGFLDVLSSDFGRALKDLTAIYADLRRLSVLGDLPIRMENKNTLRVCFPGVDAETVNSLLDDVGIERGIVGQDPDLDIAIGAPVALQFPFAPDGDKALTSPGGSARSLTSHELEDISLLDDDSLIQEAFANQIMGNPWLSEPEGYESLSPPLTSRGRGSAEFEGLEGIYRFIEECDRGRGRLG